MRPFESGFCAPDAYAVRRGVLGLGESLRAIEFGGGATAVTLEFPAVTLTDHLEVTYGIPDDRLVSKFLSFYDQTVIVETGGGIPVSVALPYRAGWRSFSVDTSLQRGTRQAVTVTVRTNGTHFPVAIDVRLPGCGS